VVSPRETIIVLKNTIKRVSEPSFLMIFCNPEFRPSESVFLSYVMILKNNKNRNMELLDFHARVVLPIIIF